MKRPVKTEQIFANSCSACYNNFNTTEREVQLNLTQKKNKTDTTGGTKLRGSSAKLIFDAPILCVQFLRGYVNIPLLQNAQPEDIEDETERFVHMFTEEHDSDVVKKIHIISRKKKHRFISFPLLNINPM